MTKEELEYYGALVLTGLAIKTCNESGHLLPFSAHEILQELSRHFPDELIRMFDVDKNAFALCCNSLIQKRLIRRVAKRGFRMTKNGLGLVAETMWENNSEDEKPNDESILKMYVMNRIAKLKSS